MLDFAAARRMMVDGQIRTSDVTDRRVIAAMLEVPRERFVPDGSAALAYLDRDLPVNGVEGRRGTRYLLKPMVIAKLAQAAELGYSDRVLDVGCATGYASAVLAKLAGSVVALEETPELAAAAAANLKSIGNVSVVKGPLIDGWGPAAPYGVIFLDGASEIAPKRLFEQLKTGGRLVGILGPAPATKAMLYRKTGQDVSGRPIFDAGAPLLPGFVEPPVFTF
jgi:protein-L-isoaspartate(D-aspartate) O-methyltransferase